MNAIFCIGNEVSLRLPLLPEFNGAATREWKWLSRFSHRLPLTTPVPVAMGSPSGSYPCHWLVVRWIDGENAAPATLRSLTTAAECLGRFVAALRDSDTKGVRIHHYRGEPLHLRDQLTREAITRLSDEYDQLPLVRAWDSALKTKDWTGEPRFFHGDLHSGNLLARNGRLSAVIDFGGLATGDPSVDAMPAWWMFSSNSRSIFRNAGDFDRSMWDRARGWALSIALIALPYYRHTNAVFANMARRAIQEVLFDLK